VLRGSGERFDFSHDRIREVAYGQLLPPRRRLLHAQVAAAIENVYRGALEPHSAALAAHCCHGELWEKALDYLRRAGHSAVACSATRDAIAYFEQALRVLEHLPEGKSRDEHTHDLRMSLGAACYSLGEFARIVEHLDAAEALPHVRDDEVRLGRMAVLRLGCLSTMGDQAAAIEAGQRGLALAEATGNRPRQAVASVMLGFSHLGRGDFPLAITFLRKSASLLQGHPEHARFNQIGLPAVFWRTWLIFSLGELGAFAEAITRGEEAVAIAEAADQPFSVAEASGAIGHLHTLKGELALAVPALERSVAICRDYKLAVLSPLMIGALGRAYALCGRLADALPTMEEAVAISDALGTMWWQARRVTNLGEGYLRAGRVDDAVTAAEKALALAEVHDERSNRAYALRFLGDIAHHRGDFADARAQLSRALALATELRMEPLVAHCHAGLGAVERSTGGRERAAEHFDTAAAMYRRMSMRRPEDGAGGHGDV
jgi:tetratricopeptide (TPR) repeat protein